MSMITHNGKDMHDIYTYFAKKQLEKYVVSKPKQYNTIQKDVSSSVQILNSHNKVCSVRDTFQEKEKKIEKKQKNSLKNSNGDYMNSLFEYEMSFQNDETTLGFVYEK